MQRKTGFTIELGGRAEQCVDVVWTHGGNGIGPFCEEKCRIRC